MSTAKPLSENLPRDKPILVLGGCGFLGSVLVRHLVEAGCKVRVFDKNTQHSARLRPILDRIELREGDYTKEHELSSALKDVHTVFHFIGTTIPETSMNDIGSDIRTNVLPTIRLLELAKERGLERLFFASSGGTVYGIPNKRKPLKESDPTNPISAYGVSKLMVEKFVQLFSFNFGLPYVIFRFANPYGPHQSSEGMQGAVSVFLSKAERNEPITIWGDGSAVRDYIYEDDLASAVLSALAIPRLTGVFNVGAGKGVTLNEVVQTIEASLGHPVKIEYKEKRTFDVPYNVLDASSLYAETGWKPRTSLTEGLRLMMQTRER